MNDTQIDFVKTFRMISVRISDNFSQIGLWGAKINDGLRWVTANICESETTILQLASRKEDVWFYLYLSDSDNKLSSMETKKI